MIRKSMPSDLIRGGKPVFPPRVGNFAPIVLIGPEAKRHVVELDGIRGIACLLIITTHCFTGLLPLQLRLPLLSYFGGLGLVLPGGVDLFFVLSGFLIGGILLDNRTASNFFRVFWTRRAGRILPVYVMLFLTYGIGLAVRARFDIAWMDLFLLHRPLLPFWSYATFTQNNVMAVMGYNGAYWVGITWSLAVEEQFYFFFPFLVYWLPRRWLVLFALVSIVIAAVAKSVLWKLAGGNFYAGYFPTPARFDALMFGFLVTCVVRNPAMLSGIGRFRSLLDVIAIVSMMELLEGSLEKTFPSVSYTLLSAVFAYGILRIFIKSEGWYNSFLTSWIPVQAGIISYAWYMYHQAANGLLHGLIFQHQPLISNWAELGVAFLVLISSAVLASLSTRFYERPFRLWSHRMRYRFEAGAKDARARDTDDAGAIRIGAKYRAST